MASSGWPRRAPVAGMAAARRWSAGRGQDDEAPGFQLAVVRRAGGGGEQRLDLCARPGTGRVSDFAGRERRVRRKSSAAGFGVGMEHSDGSVPCRGSRADGQGGERQPRRAGGQAGGFLRGICRSRGVEFSPELQVNDGCNSSWFLPTRVNSMRRFLTSLAFSLNAFAFGAITCAAIVASYGHTQLGNVNAAASVLGIGFFTLFVMIVSALPTAQRNLIGLMDGPVGRFVGRFGAIFLVLLRLRDRKRHRAAPVRTPVRGDRDGACASGISCLRDPDGPGLRGAGARLSAAGEARIQPEPEVYIPQATAASRVPAAGRARAAGPPPAKERLRVRIMREVLGVSLFVPALVAILRERLGMVPAVSRTCGVDGRAVVDHRGRVACGLSAHRPVPAAGEAPALRGEASVAPAPAGRAGADTLRPWRSLRARTGVSGAAVLRRDGARDDRGGRRRGAGGAPRGGRCATGRSRSPSPARRLRGCSARCRGTSGTRWSRGTGWS